MIGWRTPLTQEALDAGTNAIGVVADTKFPTDLLDAQLAAGLARFPDAVWVVRSTDRTAIASLERIGVEPVLAALNPYYKLDGVVSVARHGHEVGDEVHLDVRRKMRDCNIADYCERTIVFRDINSGASKWWTEKYGNIKVVESGTKVKRHRKGRKPTGS